MATIWRRTFPRTTFHILLSGIALNDFCTGLIAQSCYATSFLISSTKDSKVKDYPNLAAILHTVGEATDNFFVSVTILTITAMSIERWLYMSRSSFITSRRRYFILILMLFLPIPNVVIRVLIHQNFRYENIYKITMIYILLLFSVCFIPFTVAVPVDFITRSKAGMVTEKVSVVLVFLSSSLSPVLYFW